VDKKDNLVANPSVVLREEFDDWAILFDPDTGEAVGINPTGVFVWKRLDGKHTLGDIAKELDSGFEDVPDNSAAQVEEFVKNLEGYGLVGHQQ
jgi:SynChlorMet cassette protein ScmD